MAQPYVGEIRMFAGTFAPAGWANCDGQIMAISENPQLFQLIGTTYGGDGQSTFGLPNLQSRVPLHWGTGGGGSYQLAEMAGAEQVTLTKQEMPVHTHQMLGTASLANVATPANNLLATVKVSDQQFPYGTVTPILPIDPTSVTPDGGSQPHDNMQPFGVVRYIISLFGIYPSQN